MLGRAFRRYLDSVASLDLPSLDVLVAFGVREAIDAIQCQAAFARTAFNRAVGPIVHHLAAPSSVSERAASIILRQPSTKSLLSTEPKHPSRGRRASARAIAASNWGGVGSRMASMAARAALLSSHAGEPPASSMVIDMASLMAFETRSTISLIHPSYTPTQPAR